jgi:two-component system sensor histidine kinase FlrB
MNGTPSIAPGADVEAGTLRGAPPELAAAFAAFNETSALLQRSYAELQQRVADLTSELAEARSARLAQLAETERLASRLSSLVAALPGAVMVMDGQGRIQDHNDGATQLFGEDLAGTRLESLLARIDARSADGGGELVLADGRRLSVSVRPLEGEASRIILMTDVTDTRRLQHLLERQERLSAMGEMMARLAHQTRTPLATAILYASQLRRTPLDEAAATFTSRLLARLHHLESMIEDMLCFARGSHGGDTLIEVGELFSEAIADLTARDAPARVRIECGRQSVFVRGNRRALVGALGNLLANALELDGKTAVTLSVREHDHCVDLLVSDDGPGIPEDVIDRVFDPFFTTRSSGTGLGLAVVQSVAQGHGGEATVLETSPAGTTLRLRLPQADVAPSHGGAMGEDAAAVTDAHAGVVTLEECAPDCPREAVPDRPRSTAVAHRHAG